MSRGSITSGERKLKDLKNEINECLVKFKCRNYSFSDQDKLERELPIALDHCTCLLNKVVEEIEYMSCNLELFISKEENSCQLLSKCRDQINYLNPTLEEFREVSDDVREREISAEKDHEGNSRKLEKWERELDDAHTRMQDNLEDFVERSRRYESCESTEDSRDINDFNKSDESEVESDDMQRLRDAVSSKDKLVIGHSLFISIDCID